ncbi:MAG: TonB-dependent receptor [Methylococcaceae bacterium]|nr:TonB-dependent receptor [Methylococcaceae bacterium]
MQLSKKTLLGLWLSVAITPVLAEEARTYNIPAQPLASAIDSLSKQSGLHVFYADNVIQGRESTLVKGNYTPQQALSQMLAGSGVETSFTGENTVALRATAGLIKTAAEADSEQILPKVTVEADTEPDPYDPYGSNSPHNKSYSVTSASSANRNDTPIMETPLSIQVVPKAVIRDQQAIQVGDAIKNVSGVFQGFTFGGFAEEFMIRGFNTSYNNYLDGFRWPASRLTLANAERVEVVKGAAANLYGRIQPGGMINIVTKRPQATPYYALEQQFGSYDLYRTTLDATGTLNSDNSLMYRFNLEYLDKKSFRDFAFTDRIFLAPSLTWKISDRTQLDLDFIYSNEDTLEDYGVVALGNRPANIPINRYLHEPSTDISNSTLYNTALTLTHAFTEDWKVKARFNHFRRETTDIQTFGGSLDEVPSSPTYGSLGRFYYGSFNPSDGYYANVNLSGRFVTWGVDHEVLMGWENYSTDSDKLDPQQFGDAPTINIFNPRYQPANVSAIPHSFGDFGTGKKTSNGVYFQDQITLFNKLHILGGGRYDWITDASGFSDISSEDAISNQSVLKAERFSPRVGLLYQPWQWLSVYGNYVESLGNSNGASDPSGSLLGPEIGEQYEMGFKTAFFDERLTSNVAFYHLTKQNLAVQIPGTPFSEAIGKARSQGVEIDVSGQVTDGLSIIASYAYTDAAILKSDNNQGNRLWNVPRNAGSLWAKYDMQYEALRGLSLGAGVYFQSQKQGDNANSYQLPGWGRVDMLVKYQLPIPKAKTTLQFNIDNLLDHQYYTATLGDRFTVNVGQPRTFMGSVKVEF